MKGLVVTAVDEDMETLCCGSMVSWDKAVIPKLCSTGTPVAAIRKLKDPTSLLISYDVTYLKKTTYVISHDICIIRVSSFAQKFLLTIKYKFG